MLQVRFILVLLPGLAGCLGPVSQLYPENERQRPVPVYVISLGWHVGIAFEGEYLREILPKHDRLPQTELLMAGWGDNRYYPSERARFDLFLRAAFLPTGSVIHLVGFDELADAPFTPGKIVRVQLSREGMEGMAGYLAERFQRNGKGDLVYAAEGLYRGSAFFESKGLYFFPKTSNRWTARVLRKSGFPITPFYAFTSGNVLQQAAQSGRVISR